MSDMTVAKTILDQLGGHTFIRMTGAKTFTGSANSLTFRLPGGGGVCKRGINHVKITLDADDTYTIAFSRVYARKVTLVSIKEGFYADQLRGVISGETGLAVEFPRVLFPKLSRAAQKAED